MNEIDLNNPTLLQLLIVIVTAFAGLLLEASRRRTKALESQLKAQETDNERESTVVGGLIATANSITKMNESLIARAEATDKERETWRSMIDAQMMTQTAHVAEIRRLATGVEQQTTLLQEAAKSLKGLNTRTLSAAELKKVVADERKEGVRTITEALDLITDVLLTFYDAATLPGGAVVLENRRQIDAALAEARLLRAVTEEIAGQAEAQPASLESGDASP